MKNNLYRKINIKLKRKIIFTLFLVIVFDFFLFPFPILANQYADVVRNEADIVVKNNSYVNNVIKSRLPESNDLKVLRTKNLVVTAYNSEVAQCDAMPCITANGFNLCKHGIEDSIAANFLKFGTKVKIPELYGDKIFVVRDRMNKRYQNRVDIWMLEKDDARKFGVKRAKIEVLE